MQLGTKIMSLRKQKGLTQTELGELMNVSFMTIRRWETGKSFPKMNEARKLAEILNVSPDELLTDTPEVEQSTPLPQLPPQSEEPLVYEWGGKNRIALPNTPETRELFRQLVQSVIASAPAPVAMS